MGMSDELETVIERCVSQLTEGPARSRDEISAVLNRWEEMGLISRQMRAVIVQRLRMNQVGTPSPAHGSDRAETDQSSS